VDVHLVEALRLQVRNDLEPDRERSRVGAIVRLEIADHDVTPLFAGLTPLLQHAVRLPNPGCHPEQDPIPTAHSCSEDVVDDQVDQLYPDERQDHAAQTIDE